MKISIILPIVLFSSFLSSAQINNAKTESIKVFGNCDVCETAIENAARRNKISKAEWNEETKMADITYDSIKTNLDAVLKNIALAGFDNEKFLAPDETYNNLPGCCKYVRENKVMAKEGTGMQQPDHSGHNAKVESPLNQKESQLQVILKSYFLIKDALIKTDGVTASSKAAELLKALSDVKMETLTSAEHNVWMRIEKNLKVQAKNISETKDPDKQREQFAQLSENIYALAKVAKSPETIYWQNCPMYNDGRGANWLSKDSTVKNPYYGSLMLTCGSTVETIK